MAIAASAIFVFGYILIALEHNLKISKSAVALVMGALLWVLASLSGISHFREAVVHSGTEIFEIIAFLLAAMSLVEILVHYKFFDLVRAKLFSLGFGNRKQFILIGIIAFILSAVIDNLTATIVMVQIARRFFKDEDLLYSVALIIISANAGGAFSPIGDVTTIMLWLAGKFSSIEIITQAFLPSLAIFIVATAMMFRKVSNKSNDDVKYELVGKLGRSEKIVVGATFASFALPVVMNTLFDLPPYLGLILGLGIVWLIVDIFKRVRPKETHLEASIEKFIKQTDIASLKFFIGILLAVSALHHFGILENVSKLLYTHDPSIWRMVGGNVVVGLASAILDNVPIAAITIQILKTDITQLWALLAVTLGTGGSLLVIGSAAGVVAMGMVKELNFVKYFKIAFVPALVSFLSGVGVWCLQYFVLGF